MLNVERLASVPFQTRLLRVVPILCLLVITLAGVMISFMWATLVPVYQGPDEYAHFDYAFSLASAGRLLQSGSHPEHVSPRTQALAQAVQFDRIIFHPDERVSAAYTTAAGRRALNAIPSTLPPDYYTSAMGPRATLNAVYPPGYYALAALAMRVAGVPHIGMLSAFMATRYLSIALFAIGLCYWYGAMRETGFGIAGSLAVSAIVALAPLTSFVSSYIQPDNLSWALLAAVTFAALRVRKHAGTWAILAYGLVLGALTLTKLQFALVAAVATAPIVLFAIARSTISGPGKLRAMGILVAPAAICFITGIWAMSTATQQTYLSGRSTLLGGLGTAFQGGLGSGSAYLGTWTHKALSDFFTASGTTHLSFWGLFGWLDTPLVSSYARIDRLTSDALELGTFLVLGLAIVALVRNATRLWRVARYRGWLSAVTIATSDPLVNGYYLFVGLLLVLYITSGDLYGAQGRDFYPFEGVAFLTGVRYAPKAFSQRTTRRVISGVIFAGLAAFVLFYAPFAITSVENRYYPTPLAQSIEAQTTKITRHTMRTAIPDAETSPHYAIDDERVITRSSTTDLRTTARIPRGAHILLRGWAFDPATNEPLQSVVATIDGKPLRSLRNEVRDDVAEAFANPALTASGFRGNLAFDGLSLGRHKLALNFTAHGNLHLTPLTLATFEVIP